MPLLVLGPLLRYVGETEATIWVETDQPCEVEVLGRTQKTFHVEGHNYALVYLKDLEPGSATPYEVRLDGEKHWPEEGSMFPPSLIRTPKADTPHKMIWGSCRVSVPHEPPYSLKKDDDPDGREVDAAYAYALRMVNQDPSDWPHVMLWLGDQIYADEVSPATRDFIRTRRNIDDPPWEQVADFEEYTHLYLDSWTDPTIRWLLSTVSNSMIFDDHDVHDDWNTSEEWVEEMRTKPWWNERVIGGFMSYWLYQHLGNLSPRDLDDSELWLKVRDCHTEDAGTMLREFAFKADREAEGTRWSFCRDIARTRVIVLDSRAGRVLKDGRRKMIDDEEWDWIVEHATADEGFHHLILATTLPFLLSPGMHHLEAWNEATAEGAWGKRFARVGEWIRQEFDLEHWAAFQESFNRVVQLLREVGSGHRGKPPASIVFLSGDVHHAYLAEVAFPRDWGVKVPVWQGVCSPIRNPLATRERMVIKTAASAPFRVVTRWLAKRAGVKDPHIRWRLVNKPTFDNQISTFDWEGDTAHLCLEKAVPGNPQQPGLERSFDRRLA